MKDLILLLCINFGSIVVTIAGITWLLFRVDKLTSDLTKARAEQLDSLSKMSIMTHKLTSLASQKRWKE